MTSTIGIIFSLALWAVFVVPNAIWVNKYNTWKLTVPMSLARKQAARTVKRLAPIGFLVYAWVIFSQIINYQPVWTAILFLLWGYCFRQDWKRLKTVLDDEDFFKKMKNKVKRFVRNALAVRKFASSKVGG